MANGKVQDRNEHAQMFSGLRCHDTVVLHLASCSEAGHVHTLDALRTIFHVEMCLIIVCELSITFEHVFTESLFLWEARYKIQLDSANGIA